MVPARATVSDLASIGVAAARVLGVPTGQQQSELDAASDLIDSYLSRQYTLPLAAPYPRDIIKAECVLAAAGILDNIGWNPSSPAEKAIMLRRDFYMAQWLPGIASGEIGPNIVGGDSSTSEGPSGPAVITSTQRGYSERGMSPAVAPLISTGPFSDD